jgi:hypothetical protein
MKKLLHLIAPIIAGILAISMATSIVGAAVSETGSKNVNSNPGKVSSEELRNYFNDNYTPLESIAAQLIPLWYEKDLSSIRKTNTQITAYNGDVESIVLDSQLMQELEQYFSAIGTANTPSILVREIVRSGYINYIIVEFNFNLNLDTGYNKGIMYDPNDAEAQKEWEEKGYERLDNNWFVFESFMPGAPIEVDETPSLWYTTLPSWLQWILRYIFFGWIWMDD